MNPHYWNQSTMLSLLIVHKPTFLSSSLMKIINTKSMKKEMKWKW